MKITALSEQVRNPDRVNVFVDSKYSFSLLFGEILEHKIKIGLEIDEHELKRLKKVSEDGKLKMRTLAWQMLRPHSAREMRDYLFRKKVDNEQAEGLIEYFQYKGLQNDESFARWFAEGRLRKNKSWRAVESELYSKGISRETIQSVATELGAGESDEEALKKLIEKLSTKPRYTDEKKLIAHLVSKGFSYSSVKASLQNAKED